MGNKWIYDAQNPITRTAFDVAYDETLTFEERRVILEKMAAAGDRRALDELEGILMQIDAQGGPSSPAGAPQLQPGSQGKGP